MCDNQTDVIAFLSRPESYGGAVSCVERHDTHASIVFLAGSFAYKLKRAIRYPYLDYSTVPRRHDMCERELRINRRTAPQMYIGVKSIVRGEDGTLRFGESGWPAAPEDWVLVMQRFDQDCLLEQMRKDGRLSPAIARDLGQVIAAFHKAAEATPAYGGIPALTSVLDENIAILRTAAALDPAKVEQLDRDSRSALGQVAGLVELRRQQGLVRRCHGDLHLDNICFIDAAPVLFDAIEFSDEFSCIDVLYDVAFPLMELIRHGLLDRANALLNRYLELTGDYDGLAVLPLFLSMRAAIRTHVTLARSTRGKFTDEARDEAAALLDQAISHLAPRRPRLIAIGGVSGTGKSTLAYGLAADISPSPGAVVIRSDIIRKALLGAAETQRLPEAAYSPELHARVFSAMADRARKVLKSGFSVILDGVYGSERQRSEAAAAARDSGVPFSGLWLEAPLAILESRVTARRGDVSDATVTVLRRQRESVVSPSDWTSIDAGKSAFETIHTARACLTAGAT